MLVGRYGPVAREHTTALLNQLRDAVPSRHAKHFGRLDPQEGMAILEAYLYLRRERLAIPLDLYRSVQRQVLLVLDMSEGFERAESGRPG